MAQKSWNDKSQDAKKAKEKVEEEKEDMTYALVANHLRGVGNWAWTKNADCLYSDATTETHTS